MKTIENQIKEMSRKEREEFLIDKIHHDLDYVVWTLFPNESQIPYNRTMKKLKIEINLLYNIYKMRFAYEDKIVMKWAVIYALRE